MEREALIKKIKENPISNENGETIISTIEEKEMFYDNEAHATYWWIRKTPEGKVISRCYIGK